MVAGRLAGRSKLLSAECSEGHAYFAARAGGGIVKARKHNSVKPKAKAAPEKMEYAGDLLETNHWFKIGLTKASSLMLETIGRRLFDGTPKKAKVARALLVHALAHYDKLEPLILSDVKYFFAEDFFCMDKYLCGVIAGQHQKIAEGKRRRGAR